jgi:hypothetical protein
MDADPQRNGDRRQRRFGGGKNFDSLSWSSIAPLKNHRDSIAIPKRVIGKYARSGNSSGKLSNEYPAHANSSLR